MHAPEPAPTTSEIRDAVATIHHGVHDPEANPLHIATAHATLARARTTSESPVSNWLQSYLDDETTAHGHIAFREAVNELAQHFKLPPATNAPRPGEQGVLFT